MRYVDYACAWLLFAAGIYWMLMVGIRYPRGAFLDTALLWILVAMFNLLRLRNGCEVRGLQDILLEREFWSPGDGVPASQNSRPRSPHSGRGDFDPGRGPVFDSSPTVISIEEGAAQIPTAMHDLRKSPGSKS